MAHACGASVSSVRAQQMQGQARSSSNERSQAPGSSVERIVMLHPKCQVHQMNQASCGV